MAPLFGWKSGAKGSVLYKAHMRQQGSHRQGTLQRETEQALKSSSFWMKTNTTKTSLKTVWDDDYSDWIDTKGF